MDKRESETYIVPSLVDGLSTTQNFEKSLFYGAPVRPVSAQAKNDQNRLLDRLQPLSVNWGSPPTTVSQTVSQSHSPVTMTTSNQAATQESEQSEMERQLLALTQQFSIELTPDQIEKVKRRQSGTPSPTTNNTTMFHSPVRTSPDVIAPTAPPPQPPQSLAARNGEFSNAWNSFLLTPTKDTEQQQQQQNLFPSAHGDFSPPTFPPSTFTTTTPPPPATITAPKSLPECKSSSFDQGLLKKTIAKPKSQQQQSTWDSGYFGQIGRSQLGLESISSNINMSSHNPFERAKSLDYGLFDIEKNMSGLPEGFKKKVESLLRADADDEHDHMGQVTERKRHYAQILRISGSADLESTSETPLADHLQQHQPTNQQSKPSYAQIAPKTAASMLYAAKAQAQATVESHESRPSSTQSIGAQSTTAGGGGASGGSASHRNSIDATVVQGHELLHPEETQLLPEQLNSNYQFARVCNECHQQNRVGFDGFNYKPPTPNHQCGKTILCARPKGRETWSRVRSIPRHIDYRGPFLLCRHITQGEACPYAEACTFCYNREEEEIWTWERRGLFNRQRLFVEVIKDPLAHYMKQYGHHFWRSCKSCVDEGIYEKCACHDSQLYHIEPGAKPILVRECPDEKTMELCRYSSTNRCNRGIECFFAHSMIELDAWKMYTINEIESDDIIDKSREVAKEVEKEAEKEWVSNGGAGIEQAAVAQSFALKHRWICAICSKNGQQVARRGKTQYCAAGRNAHAWRDPILLCFVERWNIVRDLQAVFAKTTVGLPQTFVVCKNIRDKNKCDYGDVCQFSHSEEECKVWNYMKENNVKSLKQLYTKLMK